MRTCMQPRRIRLGVGWSENCAAAEVDRGRDAAVGDSAAAAAPAAASRVLRRELAVVRDFSLPPLPPSMPSLSSLPPQGRCARCGAGLALRRVVLAVAVEARCAADGVDRAVLVRDLGQYAPQHVAAAPHRDADVIFAGTAIRDFEGK